jgi:hypothetical protein
MRRVEVELWGEGETRRKLSLLQEDESPGGIALSIPMSVTVGARVRIRTHDRERLGTVRNCRRDGREYIIGVQYDVTAEENRSEENGNAAPGAVLNATVPDSPAAESSAS